MSTTAPRSGAPVSVGKMSESNNLSPCPHLYYPSIELFLYHLAWFWNQRKKHDDHYLVLSTLLRHHSLCGCCRNMLISCPKILLDLCSTQRMVKIMQITGWPQVHYSLYLRLLDHGKLPKIMMRMCRKSMSTFQSMCASLKSIFQQFIKCGQEWIVLHFAYSCFVFLTVKYWNKDQLMYFVKNHSRNIIKLIEPLLPRMKMRVTRGHSMWYNSIAAIIRVINRVNVKSQRDGITGIRTPTLMNIFMRGKLKNFMRRNPGRQVVCYSIQCWKKQKDNENQFKLCGGCKLTYYCCRSCQKRAWPQHKSNCMTLRRLYQ